MAEILLISQQGEAYGLALRLASEGHDVRYYTRDAEAKDTGRGCENPQVVSRGYAEYGRHADLTIFDSPGFARVADDLRRAGRVVLCGGYIFYALWMNSVFTNAVAKQCVMLKREDVPEGEPYVDFTVQGWFTGQSWLQPYLLLYKQNRLMDKDKGPIVACMGVTLHPVNECKLTQMTLQPIQGVLQKANYIGPLEVHVALTKDHAYFKGYTPGFTYPALQVLHELLKGKSFDFLYSIATGTLSELPVQERYATGVRLMLPRRPDTTKVLCVEEQAERHVWPAQAAYTESGERVSVGPNVGYVTAWGEDVNEARRRVYRTIHNITRTPELMYREDIGQGFEEKMQQLQEWVG